MEEEAAAEERKDSARVDDRVTGARPCTDCSGVAQVPWKEPQVYDRREDQGQVEAPLQAECPHLVLDEVCFVNEIVAKRSNNCNNRQARQNSLGDVERKHGREDLGWVPCRVSVNGRKM